MANWWDAAPLASADTEQPRPPSGANWWNAAPLAQESTQPAPTIQSQQQQPPAPSLLGNEPDDGYLSSALKSAGTAAIKGISNSIGTVGNLGHFADYLLARGDSAITGRPVNDILADYAQRRKSTYANAIDPSQVLPTGEQVAAPLLRRTGEYKSSTGLGRMAQSGLEVAASMIGPGGGAAALERGVAATGPQAGMAALRTARQLAPVNTAVGAIGQGVTDATDDPLIGMAAGIGLPAIGGAASSRIGRGVASVTRPFAEDLPIIGNRYAGAREQMVGERLLAQAQNPTEFEHALFPGPRRPDTDEIIPGSQPTTGQLTGDIGILQAERQARTADNTPFNMLDAEQNAARNAALRDLAPDADTMRPSQMLQGHLDGIEQAGTAAVDRIRNGAQELASRLGPGATPEAIGATIRDAIETTRKEAAAARSALYRAVDPDGSLALVTTPVREQAQTILKGLDQYSAPLSADEARLIGKSRNMPDVMSFKSLLEFDKDITASMAAERRTAGETPTWNRLRQLKASTQEAINNAVDLQAAHQNRAVARGEMAPEDTVAYSLRQWEESLLRDREGYYSDREAAVGDGSGIGRDAGSRSSAVSSSPRTKIEESSGLRYPAGDSSVSAENIPLTPNFDDGAAARLDAAKRAHAEYARTYREGPVGQALKTMGFVNNYVVPASGLPARIVVRGDKGFQTAQSFLKAAKNNPEAVSAMQDHVLSPLRRSLNFDGTINPAKFAKWRRDYAGALRALDGVTPGFSGRFDNAARASDILVEAGARAERMVDEFRKSEAGKLLGLTSPVEVENRVGAMLTERGTGPTQMRSLVNRMKRDPSAVDGLRKAGIDWMTRKFATTAEAGTSGEKILSAAAFKNFVKDNATTLAALYPQEQVAMFRRIADDLDRSNRSVTATSIKGSPGTAKDALPFMRKHLEEAKRHASLLSAAMAGSLIGFESAGLHGAVVGAGASGAAYLLGSLRAAGIRRADDMFRDALLHPDRARYYLSKVPVSGASNGASFDALGRLVRRGAIQANAPSPISAEAQNKRLEREEGSRVFSGAVLPFSRDKNGDVNFDSGAGIIGLAKRAFSSPGDVYAGRLPVMDNAGHTNLETIGRMADLAGLVTMGSGLAHAEGGPIFHAGLNGLRQRYAPQLNEAVNWSKDIGRIKLTPERIEAAKASLQRKLDNQPKFGEGSSPYRSTEQARAATKYAEAARIAGIDDTRVKFADGPYGSVYVRTGNHGTVRFADHPPPEEWVLNPLTGRSELQVVGGFSRELGRRHQPATVDASAARPGAPLNTKNAYDFLAAVLDGGAT